MNSISIHGWFIRLWLSITKSLLSDNSWRSVTYTKQKKKTLLRLGNDRLNGLLLFIPSSFYFMHKSALQLVSLTNLMTQSYRLIRISISMKWLTCWMSQFLHHRNICSSSTIMHLIFSVFLSVFMYSIHYFCMKWILISIYLYDIAY